MATCNARCEVQAKYHFTVSGSWRPTNTDYDEVINQNYNRPYLSLNDDNVIWA